MNRATSTTTTTAATTKKKEKKRENSHEDSLGNELFIDSKPLFRESTMIFHLLHFLGVTKIRTLFIHPYELYIIASDTISLKKKKNPTNPRPRGCSLKDL